MLLGFGNTPSLTMRRNVDVPIPRYAAARSARSRRGAYASVSCNLACPTNFSSGGYLRMLRAKGRPSSFLPFLWLVEWFIDRRHQGRLTPPPGTGQGQLHSSVLVFHQSARCRG